MNKTFDFEEFVSNSLQAEMVQDDHMKQLTDVIIDQIPASTLAVKETELMDLSASKPQKNAVIIGSEYYKQWNGRVVSIENNDTFVAIVQAVKSQNGTPKIVRFNKNKVTIVNNELMAEGATFYWTVGLFRNKHKSLEKVSEVRFKMVSKPSRALLNSIGEDLERLFDGISWMG